jgi:hypothetical protein
MSRSRSGRLPLGLALAAALILAAAPLSTALAGPKKVAGVPLPRGSRSLDDAGLLHSSGRGFRKTVRHFERFLHRAGIDHKAIPVYSYRGTAVARFLSRQQTTAWSAIHVFRTRGHTRIYVVPKPPLTSPPPKGKEPAP